MTTVMEGQCACGAARWVSTAPATHLDFCYCLQCQRVSGAPMVAWMGIQRAALNWAGDIHTYRLLISDGMDSIATRACCSSCGGTLSMQYDCYPSKTHVAAATVVEGRDRMRELKVGCHIFVREKPSWYTIAEDGAPRHDGFDDEFLEMQKKFDDGQKHKQEATSHEAPPDNSYDEEAELLQARLAQDAKQAEQDNGDADSVVEESDEEIIALRQRYGSGQARASIPVYENVDSD